MVHRKQKSSPVVITGFMVIMMLFIGLFALSRDVSAAETCVIDLQGANDEPGQKDLTVLCIDNANVPDSIELTWNWDETGWNGSNTGDGCMLFDGDSDGNANYAACVQVADDPAEMVNPPHPKLYACTDSRPDRCMGSTDITGTPTSTCDVQILPNDPFDNEADNGPGDEFPNDTVAHCTIVLNDFGDDPVDLIDSCSYPSASPNSDPSDCVITPTGPPSAITIISPVSAGLGGSPAALPAAATMMGLLLATVLIWRTKENSH